ncbi:MAG: citrate lyase subunit alpha [Bacteroidales bacterium]|nr:citrate lyase subunit alpha [Bacteroidales bacterium]
MKKYDKLISNALGRQVPTVVNGTEMVPYQGVGKYVPEGKRYAPKLSSCARFPDDGKKLVPGLKEALIKAGLKDGMTISTHHHFRNGDLIAVEIFKIAKELGVKDLVWFPSASFPCHTPLIDYMEDGTIHHMEGSMNGPLGKYTSEGR